MPAYLLSLRSCTKRKLESDILVCFDMNYELALELKEAGFPNSENWERRYKTGDSTPEMIDGRYLLLVPTLSELIEACWLFKTLENMTGGRWDAVSMDMLGTSGYRAVGKTPEDAVAKLWLALKKSS